MILRLTLRIIVSEIESMNFYKIFGIKIRQPTDKTTQKTVSDYKMDILVKQGRDQFRKLIDRGINVPIALL